MRISILASQYKLLKQEKKKRIRGIFGPSWKILQPTEGGEVILSLKTLRLHAWHSKN